MIWGNEMSCAMKTRTKQASSSKDLYALPYSLPLKQSPWDKPSSLQCTPPPPCPPCHEGQQVVQPRQPLPKAIYNSEALPTIPSIRYSSTQDLSFKKLGLPLLTFQTSPSVLHLLEICKQLLGWREGEMPVKIDRKAYGQWDWKCLLPIEGLAKTEQ